MATQKFNPGDLVHTQCPLARLFRKLRPWPIPLFLELITLVWGALALTEMIILGIDRSTEGEKNAISTRYRLLDRLYHTQIYAGSFEVLFRFFQIEFI